MSLPEDCSSLLGKVVRFNRSLYALKQASISLVAQSVIFCMKILSLEQCPADVCVFRFVEGTTLQYLQFFSRASGEVGPFL